MAKINPVIVKTFGQFSVGALRHKMDFKVYVTDGHLVLFIPLSLTMDEIKEALKRLGEIKNNISDNLEYFKMVVSGSLRISMQTPFSPK